LFVLILFPVNSLLADGIMAMNREASNCRKLLRTKAAVVNVPVKRRGL
jgi:hypothetical protein